MTVTANQLLDEIREEAARAHRSFGAQEDLNDAGWLAVLVEEVGEVARALNEQVLSGDELGDADVDAELVQVAAVALRWLWVRRSR